MEMLSNMESSEIKIQMSVPSRAGLLVPANNDNENEDILMLVMPVMLNR
jgi:DNA polymerase-3 subunit beta